MIAITSTKVTKYNQEHRQRICFFTPTERDPEADHEKHAPHFGAIGVRAGFAAELPKTQRVDRGFQRENAEDVKPVPLQNLRME